MLEWPRVVKIIDFPINIIRKCQKIKESWESSKSESLSVHGTSLFSPMAYYIFTWINLNDNFDYLGDDDDSMAGSWEIDEINDIIIINCCENKWMLTLTNVKCCQG